MLRALFKRTLLISFMLVSVGCSSLQVEKSIDALGDGVDSSIESRNKNKPQHDQNHNPHGDDLASGVLNMLFQGVVSLFSSSEN